MPKPILVVGSVNVDLVVLCERLPERGETLHGRRFFTAGGGKGANQAVAAAKLGGRVHFAGCVGSDTFGEMQRDALRDAGVHIDFLEVAEGSTGTALITVESSGANTIVVVAGANDRCVPARIDAALEAFDEPGILLVQHELPVPTVERAIRAGHERGWYVILNPAPARSVPADTLRSVDLVIPNQTEAAELWGRTIETPDDGLTAARALVAAGAGSAIVTLGEAGAVAYAGGEEHRAHALAVETVDTTAAGDAYIGALAAELASGRSIGGAMRFATAAAAIAVSRLGAQPSLPLRSEVEALLSTA